MRRRVPAACVPLAAMVLAAARCDAAADPVPQSCVQPRHVVMFVDRSRSTANTEIPPEMRDSIAAIPDRLLSCPGDQFHAFMVYGRTRGMAQRLDIGNELGPAPDVSNLPPDTRAADSLDYVEKENDFQKHASEQIAAFVRGGSGLPANDSSTDLLGTLEVASTALADAPPGAQKVLLYVSDMYESMKGLGRRDFDALQPSSGTQAEAWATADSEAVLRDMQIALPALAGARVHVYARPWGDRPNSEIVKRYWLKMFSLVGIPSNQIRWY